MSTFISSPNTTFTAPVAYGGPTSASFSCSVNLSAIPTNATVTGVTVMYQAWLSPVNTYASVGDGYEGRSDVGAAAWNAAGVASVQAALGGTLTWVLGGSTSVWEGAPGDCALVVVFNTIEITYTLPPNPVCAPGYAYDADTGSCVPTPPPPAPGGFTWLGVCEGAKASFSWTAVPGATSYRIERSEDGGATWTARGTTSGLSFVDSPLVVGRTYRYRLVAINQNGESIPSDVLTVRPCFVGTDDDPPGRCCDPSDYHGFAPPGTIYRNRTCGE